MADGDRCECVIEHPDAHADGDECLTEGPNALACSRPEGHEGDHAACTVGAHPFATWRGA